jgi:hypothetical protein
MAYSGDCMPARDSHDGQPNGKPKVIRRKAPIDPRSISTPGGEVRCSNRVRSIRAKWLRCVMPDLDRGVVPR